MPIASLVVEDVLTTGGSTRETAAVAEAHGAQVVGAAAIVDRGADPARLNLPLQALVQLEVPTYAPDAVRCAPGDARCQTGQSTCTVSASARLPTRHVHARTSRST